MNSDMKIYKDAIYNSPSHKVGIKVLDENQLETIFQDYRDLLNKIEIHRNEIQRFWKDRKDIKDYSNLMFDNVFSIMGKRGSGKTSAVYTIKKIIESEHPDDIVLPIITTETIPEGSSIIGWLLSLMEDTVEITQEKMDKDKKNSSLMFAECNVGNNKSLRQEFRHVRELCFSKLENNTIEQNFSTAVVNSTQRTQNLFDFSYKLADFWTQLRNSIKSVNKMQPKDEPLIYIIFDDVDLVPEKIWELLSTIVRYLAHPNVVVFVTADEKMLNEVVKNILYLKMCNEQMKNGMATDKKWIKKTARLYIGKVLPTSTRYYIESFENNARKMSFIEHLEFDDNKKVKDEVTIQKFLISIINDYIQESGLDKESNFLYYKSDGEKPFLKAYMMFWGSTSRQLGNECIIVNDFMKSVIALNEIKWDGSGTGNKDIYFNKLYRACYHFVSATLHTNSKFTLSNIDIERLTENVILYQPENWGVYINYRYLKERFETVFFENKEKSQHKKEIVNIVNESIRIFILLFFLENILVLECKRLSKIGKGFIKRAHVHGLVYLVEMLDNITNSDYSFVHNTGEDKDVSNFLYIYENILEHSGQLIDINILSPSNVRNILHSLPQTVDIDKEKLDDYINWHPKWFRTMVKILFLADKNLYKLGISKSIGLPDYETNIKYDKVSELLDNERMQTVCECLETLHEEAGNEKHEYNVPPFWLDDIKRGKDSEYIYSYINDLLKPYESSRDNIYFLESLLKYNDQYSEINETIDKGEYADAIKYIKEKIYELENKIDYYKVCDIDYFNNLRKRLQSITNISFLINDVNKSTNSNKKRNVGYFPKDYVNSYIERNLKVVFNADFYPYNSYEKEDILLLVDEVKDILSIRLCNDDDYCNFAWWIILKKVHIYLEAQYLINYIENDNGYQEYMSIGMDKNLYKNFREIIKNVMNNDNKDNISAVCSRHIKQYVREAVREYMEHFYYDN